MDAAAVVMGAAADAVAVVMGAAADAAAVVMGAAADAAAIVAATAAIVAATAGAATKGTATAMRMKTDRKCAKTVYVTRMAKAIAAQRAPYRKAIGRARERHT